MINIKNLFSDNTSAIGLTSLGLAKKIENSPQTTSPKRAQNINQLQQNLNLFSAATPQINFNASNNSEVLDSLFGQAGTLNFNNNGLLG